MDPRTSVWISVDPLAGKMPNISSYVYCFNNPVKLIDSDGMLPGDFFRNDWQAARDFGKTYNDNSTIHGVEFGTTIYQTTNSRGQLGYTYSIPNVETSGNSVTASSAPKGTIASSDAHTHGSYSNGNYGDNYFSGSRGPGNRLNTPKENKAVNTLRTDIGSNNILKIKGYLVTVNGSLLEYDPKNGKIKTLFTDLPNDEKDHTSPKTNNKYTVNTATYTVKKGDSLQKIGEGLGMSAKEIIKQSRLKSNIKEGQVLKVTF